MKTGGIFPVLCCKPVHVLLLRSKLWKKTVIVLYSSDLTKGKGFQGVVKRYNFSGVGGQTHGQHNRGRAPGSLGASSFPSRVFPGMRMAGRTGGKKVMSISMRVIKLLPENNMIIVKGPVPGRKGGYVIITK